MTHLRTILFDLDGTLIVDQVSLVTQFIHYCNRLGHDTAGDIYRELYRWRHEFWVDSDRINADFKRFGERGFWVEYHKKQLNFIGLNGSLDDHAEQITHWFYEDGSHRTVTVAADARATITHLRAHGLTTGLVSNRAHKLDDDVTHHNLDGLFDFTLAAGEIGVWKPNAGIFLHAMKMANSVPGCTVYVGDNYFIDIVGARNVGITPILIDPENIFPDAECKVIRRLGELRELVR